MDETKRKYKWEAYTEQEKKWWIDTLTYFGDRIAGAPFLPLCLSYKSCCYPSIAAATAYNLQTSASDQKDSIGGLDVL